MTSSYRQSIIESATNGKSRPIVNSTPARIEDTYCALMDVAGEKIFLSLPSLDSSTLNSPSVIDAMSDAIERGISLTLFLANYKEEDIVKTALGRRLAYYLNRGVSGIQVCQTSLDAAVTLRGQKQTVSICLNDAYGFLIQFATEDGLAFGNTFQEEVASKVSSIFDEMGKQSTVLDILPTPKFQKLAE